MKTQSFVSITLVVLVLSVFMGIVGTLGLVQLNFLTGLLSVFSIFLYAFIYTPLKQKSPIAVFVGAIPGAFPPMIGWVAATNQFGLEPGILFAIQFFWWRSGKTDRSIIRRGTQSLTFGSYIEVGG